MSQPIIPLLPPGLRQQLTTPAPSGRPPGSATTDAAPAAGMSGQMVALLSSSQSGRELLARIAAAQGDPAGEVAAKVAKNVDQLSTGATNRRTLVLDLLVSGEPKAVQVRLLTPQQPLPAGTAVQLLHRNGQWWLRTESIPVDKSSLPSTLAGLQPSGTPSAMPINTINTINTISSGPASHPGTQLSQTPPAGNTSTQPAASATAAPATATPATAATATSGSPPSSMPTISTSTQPLPPAAVMQRWLTARLAVAAEPAASPTRTDTYAAPGLASRPASHLQTGNNTGTADSGGTNASLSRPQPVLVSLLQSLSQHPASHIRQTLQNLLQQLPASQQLGTPQGVRQALLSSGLFMESQLFSAVTSNTETTLQDINQRLQSARTDATGTSLGIEPVLAGDRDLKAVLARVLMQLQQHDKGQPAADQTPTILRLQQETASQPLTRQIQSALADIELQQHRLVSQHGQTENTGLDASLLYRQQERPAAVNLGWHPDDNSDHGRDPTPRAKAQWRLQLELNLEGIGAVQIDARIGWPKLAVTFWSQNASALQQLHQALPPLRQRLQAAGADVSDLEARFGQAPAGNTTRIQRSLVDLFT